MNEGLRRVEAVKTANGQLLIPKPPRPSRVTAAEVIYEKLREEIVAMRLLPRTALQESQLTEKFGVSRTPVREALIRLVKEGLVDVFPQSGTFVAPVPLAEIPETLAIRKALEQVTVEGAARNMNAAGQALLGDILKRQKSCADIGDYEAFHQSDEAFHEAIAAIAGYPGIWKLLKQTKAHMDRYRRLTLPEPGRMHRVIKEHRRILSALKKKLVKDARLAMSTHLDAILPRPEVLRARYPNYFK
jgi:GntR family transcriptional regulator, rspAB operon transcriptional repressor